MDRPRAADDFATIKARMEELRHRRRAADDYTTIRARMEELRRERDRGQASEGELRSNPLGAPSSNRTLTAGRDQRWARAG